MILCDTGIIVALASKTDQYHKQCVEATKSLRVQFVTTWPCITEAMHLVGVPHDRELVRQMVEVGFLSLPSPTLADALRACALMRKYADSPMDFADASLVVAAETLNITRILTLDRHFYAYRMNDKTPLEVLP